MVPKGRGRALRASAVVVDRRVGYGCSRPVDPEAGQAIMSSDPLVGSPVPGPPGRPSRGRALVGGAGRVGLGGLGGVVADVLDHDHDVSSSRGSGGDRGRVEHSADRGAGQSRPSEVFELALQQHRFHHPGHHEQRVAVRRSGEDAVRTVGRPAVLAVRLLIVEEAGGRAGLFRTEADAVERVAAGVGARGGLASAGVQDVADLDAVVSARVVAAGLRGVRGRVQVLVEVRLRELREDLERLGTDALEDFEGHAADGGDVIRVHGDPVDGQQRSRLRVAVGHHLEQRLAGLQADGDRKVAAVQVAQITDQDGRVAGLDAVRCFAGPIRVAVHRTLVLFHSTGVLSGRLVDFW